MHAGLMCSGTGAATAMPQRGDTGGAVPDALHRLARGAPLVGPTGELQTNCQVVASFIAASLSRHCLFVSACGGVELVSLMAGFCSDIKICRQLLVVGAVDLRACENIPAVAVMRKVHRLRQGKENRLRTRSRIWTSGCGNGIVCTG